LPTCSGQIVESKLVVDFSEHSLGLGIKERFDPHGAATGLLDIEVDFDIDLTGRNHEQHDKEKPAQPQ